MVANHVVSFGNKWLNLHRGPMLKFIATEQGGPSSSDSHLLTSEVIILSLKFAYYCCLLGTCEHPCTFNST